MQNFLKSNLPLFVFFISFAILLAPCGSAEELISTDNALKKIFKGASDIKREDIDLSQGQVSRIELNSGILFDDVHSTRIVLFTVFADQGMIGYAFEDSVMGKWGMINYLMGINPNGTVLEVVVLGYQEIRGRPIAKSRFLRQYKGKTINDPFKMRKDIDGVTGATISSRSITEGIRKLLYIFNELKQG